MNRLEAIEARAQAATPGPWYPRATDDALCMNARYVSLDEGDGFCHDNEIFMAEPTSHERVVAVTLLQYPRLACLADYKWDENTEFIAHARADIPLLLAVAKAAAAYLVADKAWKDVRDDDDMDEDEVNDLWRAETDAYIALEAAVAPLLIVDVYKGADLPELVARVNAAEARIRELEAQAAKDAMRIRQLQAQVVKDAVVREAIKTALECLSYRERYWNAEVWDALDVAIVAAEEEAK